MPSLAPNSVSLSFSLPLPPLSPSFRRRFVVHSWRRVFRELTNFSTKWSLNQSLISWGTERLLSTRVKSFKVCLSCSVISLVSLRCALDWDLWRSSACSMQCTWHLISFVRNTTCTRWANAVPQMWASVAQLAAISDHNCAKISTSNKHSNYATRYSVILRTNGCTLLRVFMAEENCVVIAEQERKLLKL